MAPRKKVTLKDLEDFTRSKEYVPRKLGLKQGDVGEEVVRLQRYLGAFGYLDSPALDPFNLRAALAAPSPIREGLFDDITSEALRDFQTFNHLPVTGDLDDATLTLMSQARCGFPDVAQYVLQGSKWNKKDLTYAYQEFTPDLSQSQIRDAIGQAFSFWSAVAPLSFTEVALNNNPDITIRFASGDHGDFANFDGPGGVLAHAYSPPLGGGVLSGDAHFDEAEFWTINLPPSGVDLVSVAAHELGHSLGLAHSTVQAALMYPTYSGPHRSLDNDDITGIQALYGVPPKWHDWESLGGTCQHGVCVASWDANRLDCFVVGSDSALYHKYWDGNTWSVWESLGGFCASAPAAVSWGPNRIDVFVIGIDSAMRHISWDGASWSGWESLGGACQHGVCVASWAANRLDCFVVGTDSALHHKSWNGIAWSGWESLGGICASAPAAVSWGLNRIDVFVIGTDSAMHHKSWDGISWSGWESLGGTCQHGVCVASWDTNRLDCFVIGTDSALFHKWWNGMAWSEWESLGGICTSSPAAVSWGPNRIDVFVIDTGRTMNHKWFD